VSGVRLEKIGVFGGGQLVQAALEQAVRRGELLGCGVDGLGGLGV